MIEAKALDIYQLQGPIWPGPASRSFAQPLTRSSRSVALNHHPQKQQGPEFKLSSTVFINKSPASGPYHFKT